MDRTPEGSVCATESFAALLEATGAPDPGRSPLHRTKNSWSRWSGQHSGTGLGRGPPEDRKPGSQCFHVVHWLLAHALRDPPQSLVSRQSAIKLPLCLAGKVLFDLIPGFWAKQGPRRRFLFCFQ